MGADAPPALPLFFLETQRAVFEGLSLIPASPVLRWAPRGDGHPVLVLPGFGADDRSTRALRGFLRRQGHDAHGWRLGRNLGPIEALHSALVARVEALARSADQPVSIVGWSLGGIYARELAKRLPHRVRQVITLGSPFGDGGHASNVRRLFEWVAGPQREAIDAERVRRLRQPPPVPSTAIFSKTDGVAHWRACIEPRTKRTDNIEVSGSHCGLGVNAAVFYAVADRLSQPADGWKPFVRSGWRRAVYG